MASKQSFEKSNGKKTGEFKVESLRYDVFDWSSYSSGYHPNLILEDKPEEQSSRWLSESVRAPQYITLRLTKPSIVTSVLFSKFHRPHACNVRKILIRGGMNSASMICLCEGELHNDSNKETLEVRCTVNEVGNFPCNFIKLEPLDTWGQTNYSIWHVQILGYSDKALVDTSICTLKQYQEKEALRLCLKHLRQFDYQEAYHALAKQAHLDLEDPLLTELHMALVEKGDHVQAERLLAKAAGDGLMDDYIHGLPRTSKWQQLSRAPDNINLWPSIRGGHQVCIDPVHQMLYLFGGWDGGQDLADLWVFDIERKKWACLCKDASDKGGPSPRSCHKICLDVENQLLYILGKYLDQDTRTSLFTVTVPGDFHRYHIPSNSWSLISEDTQSDGGPRLLFDHQMCFNSSDRSIYVFGGKVIPSLLQEGIGTTIFSGLYRFCTVDMKWACLRPDYTGEAYNYQPVPRMAHVMVLHEEKQNLYILGGQRDRHPLSDMWVYNIPSDTTTMIADGKTTQTPVSGFTVRATLEPKRSEIYLHLGMISTKDSAAATSNTSNTSNSGNAVSSENHSNSLWIYSIDENQWSLISVSSPLPCPRFAHQLVLDPVQQTHYMFGGNPGKSQSAQTRLDDLWTMKIEEQNRKKLLHKVVFDIRKQRYLELVKSDGAEAIKYLKTELGECVDHSNEKQSEEFRKLTSELFVTRSTGSSSGHAHSSTREVRSELFDQLSAFFPKDQSQPRESIIDLVKY